MRNRGWWTIVVAKNGDIWQLLNQKMFLLGEKMKENREKGLKWFLLECDAFFVEIDPRKVIYSQL